MRRFQTVAVLTLAALALAGCGGDNGDEEEAATEPAATEEAGGEAADGMAIFTENCGSCHVLEAAGTSGTTGPNLDELAPDKERVAEQVTNGGGGMPAFKDTLSEEEIDAVATYVSESAGG